MDSHGYIRRLIITVNVVGIGTCQITHMKKKPPLKYKIE